MNNYWQKQVVGKPLFEELLWARPENKLYAGRLAIIGGNLHGFSAVGQSYAGALSAGAGAVKCLLPQALQKVIGQILPDAEYAPSNPSGSFAQTALSSWLSLAQWSEGVLICGDLGHNSETAIVLEKFLDKYNGPIILTQDALDYGPNIAKKLISRTNTTLVGSLEQIQKIYAWAGLWPAIKLAHDLVGVIESLHLLTLETPANIVTKHHNTQLIALAGKVVSTLSELDKPIWRIDQASKSAVWLIQNPQKPLEALNCSLID
jgi:hypothetical protein